MVWCPSQDDCGTEILYWVLMGLSSSCWLCLHLSNVCHQNLPCLSPLNTFRWKQLNHVCQQSSLDCQCQSAWLKNIQCSQCLQTCSCPSVLPLHNNSLTPASLSSVGNHWEWRSLGSLWTCAESTGSLASWASVWSWWYRVCCTFTLFSSLHCLSRVQPHCLAASNHCSSAHRAPNCIRTWPWHISSGGHNLAFILCTKVSNPKLETMCLSKLSIFIMSITNCNKRWAPQQW
jgi:hypothetical protein